MIREKRQVLVACLLAVLLLVGTAQSSVAVGQQTTQSSDVERAHERLQQANRVYQTAVATVDAARDAGADTRAFEERLEEAHTALTAGVEAVRRPQPNTDRAIESAARAELLALAVEADAEVAAKRAVANATIDATAERLASRRQSTATDAWLQRARQHQANEQFEAVERDLLYAQHAAQVDEYEAYLANLSAQGLELTTLEAELATVATSIDEGSLAPRNATRLRQSFVRADACVRRLHNATLAIERANRTSSLLVETDVTAATTARQHGYDALQRGKYAAACRHAETAAEAANSETRRVRTALERNVLARAVDVVYDALRGLVAGVGGERPAPESVHPPELTLVDVSPLSVAFSPPSPTVTPLDFTTDTVDIPPPPSTESDERRADTTPQATESDERRPDAAPPAADRSVSEDRPPSTDDSATNTETVEEEQVRFAIRIDRVEQCGAACRDVTGTLRNVGTGDAHNVEADIELSVDGTVVWTGTESVGTVPAGETRPFSQRITLGFREALQARSSGNVEAVITVRSDEHTQVIRETIAI
jgi:hypothetical protein